MLFLQRCLLIPAMTASPAPDIAIRPLVESDLPAADQIVRLAFGTFIGMPDPQTFMGDVEFVHSRWRVDPGAVVAAEHAGRLIGSNFATNWGSFGFFGPLTVHPEYWERKVAQRLLAPTMEIFREWGSQHLGLYTFAHSPKHMALYQKFGFWPRDLVAILAREVQPTPRDFAASSADSDVAYFSLVAPVRRTELLAECRQLTSAIFDGLDVEREIRSVASQKLGETILVFDNSRLAAFAVCHTGAGTEAGSGVCYVKFAAVRPGAKASDDFARLLDAVEDFARARSASKVTAGVNLARREAFQYMFSRGYRTSMQGVAMETGSADSGYNRAGVYILDDWR